VAECAIYDETATANVKTETASLSTLIVNNLPTLDNV